MKKSILALLMAAILALGLFAACSGGTASSSEEAAEPASTEPASTEEAGGDDAAAAGVSGDLEIWVYEEFYEDGENSPIVTATQAFKDANPDVNITFTPVPYGSSSYLEKFTQAAQGGGGPDVILSDNVWVPQLAAMELLNPITEQMATKKDEFFGGTIDAATLDGDIYGVPFHADSMILFYNKDMFKAAGLDPEAPPTTWEEFHDAAIALKDAGHGAYGLLGGWGGSFEWLPWFWQNGGEILAEDGTANFNSPEGMEATEFFLNMLTVDGIAPEAALTWKSWDELAAGFANQTVGMCQGMTVMHQKLVDLEPDFEWGVAPLPSRKEAANTLGGGHWVINANSANPDAAWAWIDFISSKDNLSILDDYQRVSARKDALEQETVQSDPVKQVFVAALADSRPRPIIPEWTTIDYNCIQPAFMKVIFEGADIQTAMDEAEVLANEALTEGE